MVGCHLGFIEEHTDLSPLSADDFDLRNIVDFLDLIVDLCGDAAKHEVIISVAPQGQGKDGNIVNGPGFDQGLAGARRDQHLDLDQVAADPAIARYAAA